jgi:hypothetical protein
MVDTAILMVKLLINTEAVTKRCHLLKEIVKPSEQQVG